ncbi:MAG: PPK2 family polyphosphate kinase [Thermoplasmata archaeon]|jgi:PPK2 family polyphosphate:nucleotide phosphotransferase
MVAPTDPYEILPGSKVHLDRRSAGDRSTFSRGEKEAEAELDELRTALERLQELLYAGHEHRLLIVLQGMDAAGKDGTIRHVFEGVNPQGVSVTRFRRPSDVELDHDFLWRVHPHVPAKGEIAIFNRSHYEDVLIVRVRKLVPKRRIRQRYRAINEFERMLVKEGTTILKFYLHIDFAEQGRRLRARLDDPSKHWKFTPSDLEERRLWPEYMKAYTEAIQETSTAWAPWYVVPSNRRWYRNLVISRILVRTLEAWKMQSPELSPEATAFLRKTPIGRRL